MSVNSKVIWSEGMFLRPQHFQQQSRYLESFIERRYSAQGAHSWGLQSIQIDREPLALGKVSISNIQAIFPDGTPFCAPDIENLPSVLEIPHGTQNQIVYLCIPLQRPGTQESVRDSEDFPQARYQTHNFDVRNNSSQSGESARIQVGKIRTSLKLASDDLSGYACIGIARIVEHIQDKPVKLDEHFIPPLLQVEPSSTLKGYGEEVKGLLKQRGEALSHRLSDSGRAGSAEVADYMLLQVINRVEPLIKQLTSQTALHPYQLFIELLQLSGELATFTQSDKRPTEIETYCHEDLQHTFGSLFSSLRQSLSMVMEQSATALKLVERKYGIHVAPITDPSLIQTSTFVMAVKAQMPGEVLRSRFPTQAKVASVETIRNLISTQLPGLALRALPVAPRQIPYHAGFMYFEIERSGDIWQSMQSSGGFAVHLGADFPDLQMELWAIRN